MKVICFQAIMIYKVNVGETPPFVNASKYNYLFRKKEAIC